MDQKPKIGLKDIAEMAKVSIGTVDRVVNNRGRVAPKTKQKVLEIMKELNYQPNIMASMLSGNKISKIAICLPKVGNSSFWKQPLEGVKNAELNYVHFPLEFNFYFYDRNNKYSFANILKELVSDQNQIDGLVIAPLFQKEMIDFLDNNEITYPIVGINTHINHYKISGFVGQDSYGSGYAAARLFNGMCQNKGTIHIMHFIQSEINATHLFRKEMGFKDYFLNKKNQKFKLKTTILTDYLNTEKLHAAVNNVIQDTTDSCGLFVTSSRINLLPNSLLDSNLFTIGFDIVEENTTLIENGKVDFLINQNPFMQGYKAAEKIIKKLILKKEIESSTYIPFDLVIKENCKYYLDEIQQINKI